MRVDEVMSRYHLNPFKYWVAEITGFSSMYKYERLFLPFKMDYSRSKKGGSRGVYKVYVLETGRIYDVSECCKRFFMRLGPEGDILKIKEREVEECLKSY